MFAKISYRNLSLVDSVSNCYVFLPLVASLVLFVFFGSVPTKRNEMASEIKVALLGNLSAGKSTVLNALFKDTYSEVSMGRTTAGINYFRLKNPGSSTSSRSTPKSPHASSMAEASSDAEARSSMPDRASPGAENECQMLVPSGH